MITEFTIFYRNPLQRVSDNMNSILDMFVEVNIRYVNIEHVIQRRFLPLNDNLKKSDNKQVAQAGLCG